MEVIQLVMIIIVANLISIVILQEIVTIPREHKTSIDNTKTIQENNMTIKEAIEQLEDLKRDRESFIKCEDEESDKIYLEDIKAIDIALQVLKKERGEE